MILDIRILQSVIVSLFGVRQKHVLLDNASFVGDPVGNQYDDLEGFSNEHLATDCYRRRHNPAVGLADWQADSEEYCSGETANS